MYLKSIEVHGFKSFANKIVFDFHNGITGIVGPNGSGKSNVADAVRWVLGEQRVKQLRSSSMQDVIFSGTENRKALGYAYVAITLDNSDHQLPIDYNEVTIARRVYRSGESEYLLNGSTCRLKDVNELFYDTGIGKEGYSIIGQGQIERILSGKPEDRRELFDEAAGIVKYKRRKATAQKKLENERQNLVRINDIISEIEKQIGPLEKQAEIAREYLKNKEELKSLDINWFLIELEQLNVNLEEIKKKYSIVEGDLQDTNEKYEHIKEEYQIVEEMIAQVEAELEDRRNRLNDLVVERGKIEGEINVVKEQINTAKMSGEHLASNLDKLDADWKEKEKEYQLLMEDQSQFFEHLKEQEDIQKQIEKEHQDIQLNISDLNNQMEHGKSEVIQLLNQKASTKGKLQRYDTMLEQVNIQKAQLSQNILKLKSDETEQDILLSKYSKQLEDATSVIVESENRQEVTEKQLTELKALRAEKNKDLEEKTAKYHSIKSKLDSLKNLTERYDGYGNSIKRVMEQKSSQPGLIGVVADIVKVNKEYEVAIETALGGSIQNVVTDSEQTAKYMIEYLKKNKYGRATFLPLTSISNRGSFNYEQSLKEDGVIGLASTLVNVKDEYAELASYLLGRILVVKNIDVGIAIAKKYRQSFRIVTLEGESLNAGGAMTGGAFKNSSNLLGRRREIEDVQLQLKNLVEQLNDIKKEVEFIRNEYSVLLAEYDEIKKEIQEQYILQNTAKLNLKQVRDKKDEFEYRYNTLIVEGREIDKQATEIKDSKELIQYEIQMSDKKEIDINENITNWQLELEEKLEVQNKKTQTLSQIKMKVSNLRQREEFINQNQNRIKTEMEKLKLEKTNLISDADSANEVVKNKSLKIIQLEQSISDTAVLEEEIKNSLKELEENKKENSLKYKGFFEKREEFSKRINDLDKEMYRLQSLNEKAEEMKENIQNYMWDEYELTFNHAKELKSENKLSPNDIQKKIKELKEAIKALGNVNVNAIEDYKESFERYEFLKQQHDDLILAEETLIKIIEELDAGMRKQFQEKFEDIRREFDLAFKELFGGGKGNLELVEGEDILETGIRIIAQPPGKKLQNMMQLSGGEKALTAISLLFAIQNLKPSPFCLLDEIEAALDDSNVGRFAHYLNKLTKHTQFIIITHRRGTMSAADRLYGITMQEKGISTLVSVNLIEEDLEE